MNTTLELLPATSPHTLVALYCKIQVNQIILVLQGMRIRVYQLCQTHAKSHAIVSWITIITTVTVKKIPPKIQWLLITRQISVGESNTYLNLLLPSVHSQKQTQPSPPVEARYLRCPCTIGENYNNIIKYVQFAIGVYSGQLIIQTLLILMKQWHLIKNHVCLSNI